MKKIIMGRRCGFGDDSGFLRDYYAPDRNEQPFGKQNRRGECLVSFGHYSLGCQRSEHLYGSQERRNYEDFNGRPQSYSVALLDDF